MNTLTYSFIIPILNEEFFLRENIKILKDLFPASEIIVVDSGSADGTANIAIDEKVILLRSERGRGIQMNIGANYSHGNILCFLHADTFLPTNAAELLGNYFDSDRNKICRFKLCFDIDHWLLNKYKFFSKYDSIFSWFGDMCISVRKDFFHQIGGFPDWSIFEDVDLLRRASRKSKVAVLNAEVISSARAFAKFGVIRQQLFYGFLMVKFLLGFRNFIFSNLYYRRKGKSNRASIMVFARYPVEGKVKTRLAFSIGQKYATEFYKIIAKKITEEIKSIRRSNKYIFYSKLSEKEQIMSWLGSKFFYALQEGISLGEKMQNAFQKVFSNGAEKAIIFGTDIPDLSAEIITKAVSALDQKDIVIGPAKDGGYYLLGMKKYTPELFDDIQFSTKTVMTETLDKINSMRLTFELLEELQDIDTENDLVRWLGESRKTSSKSEIELIYNLTKGRIKTGCAHCSPLQLQ
ncbi:MAG: TIGR04282 family arsenosugar biosynthesis glycosyltransferase [Bacteroidetes bacterium]|nr:TIGR04282 family arsenosugar biosynthesis glycosyltransferase [Bacteroidota bacterium]MBU2506622.1 TIGR04282 family arsenosugar biosynthesis glycosyltransferase [Bacteroidota bacterium]